MRVSLIAGGGGYVKAVAAVDLGATSGRVVVGRVTPERVELEAVARFANGPVRREDGLHWDIGRLFDDVVDGLAAALAVEPDIASIGVDSWAVDYGLLASGELLGEPFHYRDQRSAVGVAATHEQIDPSELYRQNGLQFLAFNSVYQLVADRLAGRLDGAELALLIPDLIGYWLPGKAVCERTNASPTGLLDAAAGWNTTLLERLELPATLFPPLVDAGTVIGLTTPAVTARLGASHPLTVVAVGSHDTASAVAAVPMDPRRAAYVSCGTWALAGVELDEPLISDAARAANFTNELGVDSTVRFLRNVMGLWMLDQTIAEWQAAGEHVDLPTLLAAAGELDGDAAILDVDDPRFVAPGPMTPRIAAHCAERGLVAPVGPAATVHCIVASLAAAIGATVAAAGALTGRRLEQVHVVGGGARNDLLCQLLADELGVPVAAGPVEATALGNVLVQAASLGVLDGGLAAMRSLVARSVALEQFVPRC